MVPIRFCSCLWRFNPGPEDSKSSPYNLSCFPSNLFDVLPSYLYKKTKLMYRIERENLAVSIIMRSVQQKYQLLEV